MWKKSRKGSFNYMLQSRRHFTSQLAELLLCILSKMKMTEESREKNFCSFYTSSLVQGTA